MKQVIVKLQRQGKNIVIVMRSDDYSQSISFDKVNNPLMKYGSGARWNVIDVKMIKDCPELDND